MITLRPYQQKAISDIGRGWRSNKRQVFVSPTGSGKTVTFVEMARLASERGKTILILTHRTELFNQTHKSFGLAGLTPHKIHPNESIPDIGSGVYVAMVETLARREELIDSLSPDLIIIDEAHFGNFNKMIEAFPDAYVLAVTATPVGKHFYEYYSNIVQTIDTPDLIDQGFLVPCKAYQMVDDFSDLKKGASGDYSEKSQFNHFDKNQLYKGVIDEYRSKGRGKTIVFNCNIKHSDKMAAEFNAAGIKSHSLTSKTSKKERERILDEFENGDCIVLNNASILTAGYDYPPTETIILNRATDSIAMFLQMIGRGSRLSPGKDEFIVLDFGGNHNRHGLWSQPRTWELKAPKRKRLGAAVVKDCPKCAAMLAGSAPKCQYCGYEFPVAIFALKDGVMKEYFEEDIPDKPLRDCEPREYAILVKAGKLEDWRATAILRRIGMKQLKEYGAEMGRKPGWAYMQMKFKK